MTMGLAWNCMVKGIKIYVERHTHSNKFLADSELNQKLKEIKRKLQNQKNYKYLYWKECFLLMGISCNPPPSCLFIILKNELRVKSSYFESTKKFLHWFNYRKKSCLGTKVTGSSFWHLKKWVSHTCIQISSHFDFLFVKMKIWTSTT